MQAQLTIPVLLVTLAVTPPFLLQISTLDGKLGSQQKSQLLPWQVITLSCQNLIVPTDSWECWVQMWCAPP